MGAVCLCCSCLQIGNVCGAAMAVLAFHARTHVSVESPPSISIVTACIFQHPFW